MPTPTGKTGTHSKARKRWTRLVISLAALLVFLGLSQGLFTWGLLDQVEHFLYDARVQLTMPNTIDKRIVIVDIDERSLAVEGQWPWRRDKVGKLLDQLFDHYGVRAAGFDVVFAEQDKSTALILGLEQELRSGALGQNPAAQQQIDELLTRRQPDRIFADAMAKRNIVLGYYFKSSVQPNEQVATGVLPPAVAVDGLSNPQWLNHAAGYTANLADFQHAASGGGFFDNPFIDSDGSMREVPLLQYYNGQYYESLSLALARTALNMPQSSLKFSSPAGSPGETYMQLGKAQIRINADASILIPYRGRQGAFPYVSATDVINAKVPIDTLFDTIVLIGTTAPGLMDLRTTPVAHAYAGVEVHANMVSGLLDSSFKHEPVHRRLVQAIVLVTIGLVMALILPALSALGGILLVAALILGIMLINLLAWVGYGLVLPMASPILYSIVVLMLQMTYSFLVESRSKRRLSQQFGQYVPREIVDEMALSEAEISLQGTSREMTVLFSDVLGFTRIAEGMEPSQLTELMNAFLTPITRTIHQHRGTVDKYMGDAVMAFWGAPITDAQHAQHAVLAAMDMVKAMEALWPEFSQRGWRRIEIGIGINTGVMHVGNMGSEFRVAYTVLGDAVNLGSRLEALTRRYEVKIIVSEFTVSQTTGLIYRELDRVLVKGKDVPVTIYEPLGPSTALTPAQADELSRHDQALGFYRLQNWDGAERAYLSLRESFPDRALYRIYLDRIGYYRLHPPGPGWDGVYRYESK